ncbi:hypothetical protein [Peterkaempfera griseoplana]|uniref:hypothetical protein n=1 Tax=Peterkaempfera griseoplana TaxID=66896 RepID=UPI0006E3CF27|nr:hypothetical protein [Peterkaempfera griseoplana]
MGAALWQRYDANARFVVQPAFCGEPGRFVVYDRAQRADVTADNGEPLVFNGESAAASWLASCRRSGTRMTLR